MGKNEREERQKDRLCPTEGGAGVLMAQPAWQDSKNEGIRQRARLAARRGVMASLAGLLELERSPQTCAQMAAGALPRAGAACLSRHLWA